MSAALRARIVSRMSDITMVPGDSARGFELLSGGDEDIKLGARRAAGERLLRQLDAGHQRLGTTRRVDRSAGIERDDVARDARRVRQCFEHARPGFGSVIHAQILAAGHREAELFGMNRSEEHTSELQSLMRISSALF